MKPIYRPRGKAAEYSSLAMNIYMGCENGCKYCYAPLVTCKSRKDYTKEYERENIISSLKAQLEKEKITEQVLLSFMSDPYCQLNEKTNTTREIIKILMSYNIPIAILTKGGKRVEKDLDIIEGYDKIKTGATLTFATCMDSLEWEPNAAKPGERIKMLELCKYRNIKTWVSLEPVIKPDQSLTLIRETLPYVDSYMIGKLNYNKELERQIGWETFLRQAVEILRKAKKPFYVKKDLREAAPGIKLYKEETIPDIHYLT